MISHRIDAITIYGDSMIIVTDIASYSLTFKGCGKLGYIVKRAIIINLRTEYGGCITWDRWNCESEYLELEL